MYINRFRHADNMLEKWNVERNWQMRQY